MRGATACWDCAGYRKHSEPPRTGGPGMSGLFLLGLACFHGRFDVTFGPDLGRRTC